MQIRSLEGMSNFTCLDNDLDNFKGLCLELQLKEISDYLVEHNRDKVAGVLYLHKDVAYDFNRTTQTSNWIENTHTVCESSTAMELINHAFADFWEESELKCN